MLGFGMLKFVVEVITMVGLLIVMKKVCPPESFKKEKFSVVMDCGGFCKYVKEFAKIVFGWYAYYAGSECITILIGELKNVNLMAAWAAVFNLQTIVWVIGGGISNTIRTDVGMKVGQGKPWVAKKYAYMGLILTFLYSAVMGVLMTCFSEMLSDIFTKVPGVLQYMVPMVWWGGFQAFFSGAIPSIATL